MSMHFASACCNVLVRVKLWECAPALLHQKNILIGDLVMPTDFYEEECKYMGLCRLGEEGKARRIGEFTSGLGSVVVF